MEEKYQEEYESNRSEHDRTLYFDFKNKRCTCFGFNYNKLNEDYDFFGCISWTQIREAGGSFIDAIAKEYGLDKKDILLIGDEDVHDWMLEHHIA